MVATGKFALLFASLNTSFWQFDCVIVVIVVPFAI